MIVRTTKVKKDQEIEDQDGCIKKNSRQGERAQTICG